MLTTAYAMWVFIALHQDAMTSKLPCQ